jgi:hypothetical protein
VTYFTGAPKYLLSFFADAGVVMVPTIASFRDFPTEKQHVAGTLVSTGRPSGHVEIETVECGASAARHPRP